MCVKRFNLDCFDMVHISPSTPQSTVTFRETLWYVIHSRHTLDKRREDSLAKHAHSFCTQVCLGSNATLFLSSSGDCLLSAYVKRGWWVLFCSASEAGLGENFCYYFPNKIQVCIRILCGGRLIITVVPSMVRKYSVVFSDRK